MRRLAALFGVVVVLAALAGDTAQARPVRAPVPVAARQSEGLVVDGRTTYRLDVDAGVVSVRTEATLTNTLPSRVTGNVIETPYFDTFVLGAAGPIAGMRATGDGRSLAVSIEDAGGGFQTAIIDLSPDLVHGDPQTIVVEYDLPAQPVRSDSATRINDAFASWYVIGVGDPGAIDVVIDVPDRFDVELTAHPGARGEDVDGRIVYSLDDLLFEDSYFGVSATDDDFLLVQEVDVDDDTFEIQGWPGDDEWVSFAADAAARGVPALEDVIGLPLEGERSVEIVETATPYLYGYGGWFLESLGRIEVGDELDLQTMLHELSHLWFNGRLFDSRWINEGLAEVVSNRATEELGDEALAVEALDPAAPGALPLNAWSVPDLDNDVELVEAYGYSTSYGVMDALVAEIGDDGLRTLLDVASRDRIAYVGDPDAETTPYVDWRYLYDLLDRRLDSEEVVTLFDQYVFTDEDRSRLAERGAALERYDELAEEGESWSVPLETRRAMASWEFDRALETMDEASATLEQRDALAATLEPLAIGLPPVLEEEYESTRDVGELIDEHRVFHAAARRLVDVDEAAEGVGLLGRIGFLGSGLDGDLDDAEEAFLAGDLDAVSSELDDAEQVIDGATAGGVLRLGAAAALVALAVLIVRFRRRRRRVERDDEPSWETADFTPPEAGTEDDVADATRS